MLALDLDAAPSLSSAFADYHVHETLSLLQVVGEEPRVDSDQDGPVVVGATGSTRSASPASTGSGGWACSSSPRAPSRPWAVGSCSSSG